MAADAAAGDQLGRAVAIDGDTMVVGAPGEIDAGVDSGAAYVFVRTGTTWTEQARLVAGDAVSDQELGVSVAIDGDTVMVGGTSDTENGYRAGAAYVFTRTGTTWTEQAKLTGADSGPGELMGISVAIDGDTAAVGSYLDDTAEFGDSGSAYVFTRSGGTWSQEAKIVTTDDADFDRFGWALALDGDTMVLAAPTKDDAGNESGSAFVFTRVGTDWTERTKLAASDAEAWQRFGASVAIDGGTILVGADYANNVGAGTGAAYVFTGSGDTWTEQAKLTASDAALGDTAGVSVALEGDVALVGAARDDDAGTDSGSALVFSRTGPTWSEGPKLDASDAAAGDLFGDSVALSGDTAVVGAPGNDDDGSGSGASYAFGEALPTLTPGNIGVTEADTVVQVPISLDKPADADVTVDFATYPGASTGIASPGSDFVATSGTLTIPAGDTTGYVDVTLLDDAVAEAPLLWGEWLIVTFSNPSANADLQGSFYNSSIVIILDND